MRFLLSLCRAPNAQNAPPCNFRVQFPLVDNLTFRAQQDTTGYSIKQARFRKSYFGYQVVVYRRSGS
jgi:hypothetical protein